MWWLHMRSINVQVLEETGLHLSNPSFAAVGNSVFSATSHFVTIFMRANVGEVRGEAVGLWSDCCACHKHQGHSQGQAQDRGCLQDAEARNMEPDKCAGWQWVPFCAIPEPVFLPLRQLLASSYQLHPGS